MDSKNNCLLGLYEKALPADLIWNDRLKIAKDSGYDFLEISIDETDERTIMQAKVIHQGRIRDYFGLNRAKHAVLEAAILATRTHIIAQSELETQYRALAEIVKKTAGPEEQAAFDLLEEYISKAYAEA